MSHAFWEWSLSVYDDPDVRTACLALQDEHGLNVNICLWCAWLASEGRDATPALETAIARLEPWSSDITHAIRKVRRQLGSDVGNDALYKSILACELDAEHVEQDILFALSETAPAAPASKETAASALHAYAGLTGAGAGFTNFLDSIFLTVKKV